MGLAYNRDRKSCVRQPIAGRIKLGFAVHWFLINSSRFQVPNFLIRPTTNVQTNGKQSRDNVSRDLQGGDPSAMHNIWPRLFKR